MNDAPKKAADDAAPDAGGRARGDSDAGRDDIARLFTQRRIIYGLYGVGVVFPVATLAGLIIAYIARGEIRAGERGEGWLESHYTFLIRTFWIGLLYGVVSAALVAIMIGPLLLLGVSVWFMVRIVRGWLWMEQGAPVPAPESWWLG